MTHVTIPIVPRQDEALAACSGAEPFALAVLDESMAPEFRAGDVIVIEPGGLARDGAFVLAWAGGEWIFRRLVARGGRWRLAALDPRYPAIDIEGLDDVRGVVIQKSPAGRRRGAVFFDSSGAPSPQRSIPLPTE
jgi:SOS-response transcriptional repressor LexA